MVLAVSSDDLAHTGLVTQKIDTGFSRPIWQPARCLPLQKSAEADALIKEMLQKGVNEPSSSPWALPIILVKKKDGSTHFCVDYRMLNDASVKNSYPLPRIDNCLDALAGSKWFSTLDLCSSYWQVAIDKNEKLKNCLHERERFVSVHGHELWSLQCFRNIRAADGEGVVWTPLEGLPSLLG